jgi:hypothetical protein
VRARYYYRPDHPLANHNGMVDSRDLGEYEAPLALNAPVMVDRFYENTSVPVYENGQVKQVDIGSRKRHREYMRQRGLTTADDFDKPGGEWERAAKEREQRAKGIFPDARERRQELGRIAYEVDKRARRR